jgi:hypothetical protein
VIFLANFFVTKTNGIISDDSRGRKFCNIAAQPVALNINLQQFESFRTAYGSTSGLIVSVISVLTMDITPDTIASTEIPNCKWDG